VIRTQARRTLRDATGGRDRGNKTSGRFCADLRDFIDQVERLGASRRIEGADPVREIGASPKSRPACR
jgi:hypothetical protein